MLRQLFFRLQLTLRGGGEQLLIGQRIPESEGESGCDVVSIRSAGHFAIEKERRFQCKQDGPFRGFDHLFVLSELTFDDDGSLLAGQRSPKGTLGKGRAECLQLLGPIFVVIACPGEFVETFQHVSGRLNRSFGHRRIPFFRDGTAAFPTEAAIVRWKLRGHHKHFRRSLGRQRPTRNRFRYRIRLAPKERDRRLRVWRGTLLLLRIVHALFGFRVVELDGYRSAREEKRAARKFSILAGLHPGVDQRTILIEIVHP